MSKDFLYPLRNFHGRLSAYRRFYKEFIVPFKQEKRKNGKCVFFVLTPTHTHM